MQIFDYFQHLNLTKGQHAALQHISDFIETDERIFILKGYAGTGKTTLIKGLVPYLQKQDWQVKLMAPTGRAAKIIQQKTGESACTIHKGIYSLQELEEHKTGEGEEDLSFLYQFKIDKLEEPKSVLIVDEASMIGDIYTEQEFFRYGSGRVLKDLLTYSQVNNPTTPCKIIFVGDPAQLPPIGMNSSPALDEEYFLATYQLPVRTVELTEVKRQDGDNGILEKATRIRQSIMANQFNDFDVRTNNKDIFNLQFDDFLEAYKAADDKKIVICYKNATQKYLNQLIRVDKYGDDLPIQKSDVMIVGKNNYRTGLMNGEFAMVDEVENSLVSRTVTFKTKGGKGDTATVTFHWRKVALLVRDDFNKVAKLSAYLLENYLNGDGDLSAAEKQGLYVDFMKRHPNLKRTDKQFSDILCADPFYNALMLKYGYAITCHKAQGGEWPHTFVFWDKAAYSSAEHTEMASVRKGKTNADFYRWAYTAITRSSKYLYGIGTPYFNSFSAMFFVEDGLDELFATLEGDLQEEIHVDYTAEVQELFKQFDLENLNCSVQDHFLAVWHRLKAAQTEIIAFGIKGYEAQYQVSRGIDKLGLKFWFNGKGQFKPHFQKIPSLSTSDTLFEEVSKLLLGLPIVQLNRNDVVLIADKIIQEMEIEEENPFLRVLEEELTSLASKTAIVISGVEHLNYKERYTFSRKAEKAVLDIDYNSQGFFGRVTPHKKSCNSAKLLSSLRDIINQLKNLDHVVQRS